MGAVRGCKWVHFQQMTIVKYHSFQEIPEMVLISALWTYFSTNFATGQFAAKEIF